jgi:hypothetical protein
VRILALARKGSRLITVDGVTYRWRIRHRPGYHQGNGWSPLTFVVEHADAPGRVLVVSLPAAHPGNWMGLPVMAVRPATVACTIRMALGRGWRAAVSGIAFRLGVSREDLAPYLTDAPAFTRWEDWTRRRRPSA